MSLEQSNSWWRRAERVIPMGTQTLSKSPTQFVQGVSPIFLQKGKGAYVWDVDGQRYLDYPMALGPVLLGYAEPVVDEAIRRQLESGIVFTLMHPLEVEVAEQIVTMCPGVESVRFLKSGSEALSAAIRIARSATGRDHVLVAGYHGWHDWYIGSTSRNRGIPGAVKGMVSTFEYNDLGDLERKLRERKGEVAAIVLEPSGSRTPEEGFLEGVVELARSHHCISVFDEVITGFRLAPGGARERYGVIPDLSCYGKALGNGMPIAAVAGAAKVMKELEEVFVSGTHGGETLSLAAAAAVLETISDGTVLKEIRARGETLMHGVSKLLVKHDIGSKVKIGGEPERSVIGFQGTTRLITKSYLQQELIQRGILFNGSMFISARHSDEDIRTTITAMDEIFGEIAAHDDLSRLLKGSPVQEVFRSP